MHRYCAIAWGLAFLPGLAMGAGDAALERAVAEDHAYVRALYVDLHQHPELHAQEQWTGARIADEMRQAGFDVKAGIGGHGAVGVLRNGDGPTLLLRTILDALPIAENTGLPFASKATATATDGTEVPVAHVCGHDAIMAAAIGAARFLAAHRDGWRGTLVVLAQPADESLLGARAMLADGLLDAIPKPDYIIGYHLLPEFSSKQVAWVSGHALAGSETAEIIVRGIPGHASFPAAAKDPVPLAAQIILALQTFIAREVPPLEAVTLNVGSIHGGQEVSAIPAEVKLGLSMSFYSNEVCTLLRTRIPQIAEAHARALGLPDDRMPVVKFLDNGNRATYNDPALTARAVQGFEWAVGAANVVQGEQLLGTDETAELAHAYPTPVPMMFFYYGSSDPEALAASRAGGKPLPSLHAPEFAPDADATLTVGIKALVGAVVGILPP